MRERQGTVAAALETGHAHAAIGVKPVGVALSSLRQGETGIVCESRLDADDAALVRAMGLCLNATVKVVRTGHPCVVAIGGVDGAAHVCACGGTCRIGLARGIAERIFVRVERSAAA